jgi:hypothetical protein
MRTVLIGVGSRARQGKDTVVKTIIEHYAHIYDVRRFAFADELKREVEEIGASTIAFKFGVPLDPNPPMDDPLCPNGKHSRVLQFWGEYRRKQNDFYWVTKLKARIEQEKPQFALISDMRYLNERAFVKANKGYTIKVYRPGYVDLARDPNHISETQLDNAVFDYTIINNTTLEQLQADALQVFAFICSDLNPVTEAAA